MKNPFLEDGVLNTTASINKVIIEKMPTDIVQQDITGKEVIHVFSTKLMIKEIKKHAKELHVNLEGMEEKMLPHYLEECLSSDDSTVRKAADDILKTFGERLAVILLCLKTGEEENRRKRQDWTKEHWEYWKQLETVILVGGLANSYLGERLKYYAEKVFSDAKEGYYLVLGSDSAYAGLRGCTNYLKKKEAGKVTLIFDFGQTFTKRSYARTKENQPADIRVLDSIISKHVEWDVEDAELEQKEAVLLNENFLRIVVSTITEVEEKGLVIGEEMIVSIANYVKDGKLANRGGYGKLRLIATNYAQYLECVLREKTGKTFCITLIHDGTAMAAGYVNYQKAVCLSLGTAFGVGFPEVLEF